VFEEEGGSTPPSPQWCFPPCPSKAMEVFVFPLV